MEWDETYEIGYWITSLIIFVICYIYCIARYGFLLGVGLGWLPSGIVARIVGFLWPLVVFLILVLIVYIFAISHP